MKRRQHGEADVGMPLARYRSMRDFGATPEPRGAGIESGEGGAPAFTVQRHAARRLHYDFRLELDGVLKSWAVPKGPSLDPHERRLAVETEDHPLDYGDFEGVIPAKQYGAGEVVLWDRGVWASESPDPVAALAKGKLKFRLEGEKLRGGWTLVRMHGRAGEDGARNWLLIKEDDDEARSGDEAEITVRLPGSVKRRVDELAADSGQTAGKGRNRTSSAKAEGGAKAAASGRKGAARKSGGDAAAALPAFVAPQLASLVAEAPPGKDWVYEIKYDGYRVMARVESGKATLFTRSGHDWTARLPQLAQALAALGIGPSWLDGEIVVNGADGLPDFQSLQSALDEKSTTQVVYYLFDAPWLDGRDLSPLPLLERKEFLADALAGRKGGAIGYSEHFAGDIDAVLEQACRIGLEGLIGKRGDARYASGRSRTWIKVKCRPRQEFVIGGYTDPGGSRKGFGALLVGLYDDAGALNYAGRVGTGFDARALARLSKRLASLECGDAPFARKPRGAGQHWVKPVLVAEIEYAGWTREGLLRQASFIALREDKPAPTVQDESPMEPAEKGDTDGAEKSGPVRVVGVVISNADRVVWPDTGLTKSDLARYYEKVGDWLLPHIVNRPLSLLRCPDGSAAECFFQRHMGRERPGGVETFVREGSRPGSRSYLYVTNLAGVIGMVQRGVVEFHTWGSTMPRADRPDRFTIDLDPSPEVGWAQVVEAAQLVHGLLDELGLASFVKTTGGKGLHVVVPLRRGPQWDEVKRFTKAIAAQLARTLPDRFTANMAKNRRTGRIFVDYLRNGASATAVCAYAARARPGATVSTPLSWGELRPGLNPADFTIVTLPGRLAGLREDPWRDYTKKRFTLTRRMWEALGESPS